MKPTIIVLHLPGRGISSIPSPKIHLRPRPPILPTMVPLCCPGRQSRLPPTATFSPAFSTRTSPSPLTKKSSTRGPPSPAKPGSAKTHDQDQTAAEGLVQAPSVSFEGLGISRNMKVVLLVILGVFGSIETYFWCRAIWTWWKGDEEVDGQ